jgi:hypothetical protein
MCAFNFGKTLLGLGDITLEHYDTDPRGLEDNIMLLFMLSKKIMACIFFL